VNRRDAVPNESGLLHPGVLYVYILVHAILWLRALVMPWTFYGYHFSLFSIVFGVYVVCSLSPSRL
jgi:hypothetical protein